MSKNFEKEYIALTEVEVPDLWDRIEAGLTPKSAQNPEKNEASMIEFQKEVVSKNESENKKISAPLYFMKKYKTVLAAAVCVIVILPAAVLLGQMGMGGVKEECAPADMAAAETVEYTITTEAAAEEGAVEESAVEESAVYEVAAEEMPAEATEDGYAEDMYAEDTVQNQVLESAEAAPVEAEELKDEVEDRKESAEAKKTQAAMGEEVAEEESRAVTEYLDTEDGTVLSKVTVRLFAIEEVNPQGEHKGMGTLYRAEVLEDADGLLEAGEEILIYLSPLSSTYLPAEDNTYMMMLEYDSTREYPFHLKDCY